MKKLSLLLILLFFSRFALGFEIVYPKTKNPIINSPTTFFIGSSKFPLKINGENVPLHPTGAFAYFVKLPSNTNVFKIQSDSKEEIYTITKKSPKNNYKPQALIEYKNNLPLIVDVENTPLRSTPVNAGINRISHLQKGVLLVANGEKGSFYRVKLENNKIGWIDKNSVKSTVAFTPAKIIAQNFEETDNDYKLIIHLDKRIPFEIIEGEDIKLKLYNTKGENTFSFPYKYKTGSSQLFGYEGKYIDNDFVLTIKKPPAKNLSQPLKGITITIDAGHGGKEFGAIGCLGDKEKDVVLNFAKYLSKELTKRGATVIMTRNDDSFIPLYDRVKIANQNNSMFFISIHNNALPDTLDPNKHRGTSVYYYYDQAKIPAQNILDEMVLQLGTNNDNLHQQSFAVIRNTNAISILIEVAYLINPYDNELLINPIFQQKTAKAIADGVQRTFSTLSYQP